MREVTVRTGFPISSRGIVDRYLLALAARPVVATLAIVMPALLMERLIRLFDLLANDDVPALAVARMLLDLMPHYLGLALPAALFVGIYLVIARLSAENELDALQNTGISLVRISRPFLLLGAVCAVGGIGLYGWLQPHARYAYRAAFHAATEGGWNAGVVPGEIVQPSRSLLMTADRANGDGDVHRVVIFQHLADGEEKVTTARDGRLALSSDGGSLTLTLFHAIQIDSPARGAPATLTTPATEMSRPFTITLARFRARGADERELTSGELWRALDPREGAHGTGAVRTVARPQLECELHGRFARALALALIPLLAVPLGLGAKRRPRQYGMVVGVILLVLFLHALQLAQSLGSAGLVDGPLLIWGITAMFAGICAAAFHRAQRHGEESPLDALADWVERAFRRRSAEPA